MNKDIRLDSRKEKDTFSERPHYSPRKEVLPDEQHIDICLNCKKKICRGWCDQVKGGY